jgi:Kef-type K+ transport system membrane component KefB
VGIQTLRAMQERAIIPLLPAVTLAFICGVIGAAIQLTGSSRVWLALVGAVIVGATAASSVLRDKGEAQERTIVAVLRSLLAVAVFGLVYFALLTLLADGNVVLFLLFTLLAGGCALILTQQRVSRPASQSSG